MLQGVEPWVWKMVGGKMVLRKTVTDCGVGEEKEKTVQVWRFIDTSWDWPVSG